MKFSKKALALVVAIVLVLCAVPMSFSFAAAAVAPVVVADVTNNGGLNAANYEAVATLPEAIAKLGTTGGTLYIATDITLSSDADFHGSLTEYGAITIESLDKTAKNTITFKYGNGWEAPQKFLNDVTFKNVKLANASNTDGSKTYGLSSNSHTITLGEGVEAAAGASFIIGPATRKVNMENKINVNSSELVIDRVTYNSTEWKKSSSLDTIGNTIYNLSAGTVKILGFSAQDNSGGYRTNQGSYLVNVNGATVDNAFFGSPYMTVSTFSGDVGYLFNSGKLGSVYFSDENADMYRQSGNEGGALHGNLVLMIDDSKVTGEKIITARNDNMGSGVKLYDMMKKADESKAFVAIINNAVEGGASFVESTTGHIDYKLRVTGGSAIPVLIPTDAADASTSTLVGFMLTSTDANAVPYVGGEALTKVEGQQYYDLTAYKGEGLTEISFVVPHTCAATGENVANCQSAGKCDVCGIAIGEKNPEKHAKDTFTYTSNGADNHTKKYECCGVVAKADEAHVNGTDNVCDLCNYETASAGGGTVVSPNTGDSSAMMLWVGVLMVSVAAAFVCKKLSVNH